MVWSNMLLVILTAIATTVIVLQWCGVTPRGIVRSAKEHVTPNRLYIGIVVALTCVAVCLSVIVWVSALDNVLIRLSYTTVLLYFCFIGWRPIIDYYFHPQVVLRRTLSAIELFGLIPALVLLFVGWDVSLWRKLVPLAGGFAVGFAASYAFARIGSYVRKRRAKRASKGSEESKQGR